MFSREVTDSVVHLSCVPLSVLPFDLAKASQCLQLTGSSGVSPHPLTTRCPRTRVCDIINQRMTVYPVYRQRRSFAGTTDIRCPLSRLPLSPVCDIINLRMTGFPVYRQEFRCRDWRPPSPSPGARYHV